MAPVLKILFSFIFTCLPYSQNNKKISFYFLFLTHKSKNRFFFFFFCFCWGFFFSFSFLNFFAVLVFYSFGSLSYFSLLLLSSRWQREEPFEWLTLGPTLLTPCLPVCFPPFFHLISFFLFIHLSIFLFLPLSLYSSFFLTKASTMENNPTSPICLLF